MFVPGSKRVVSVGDARWIESVLDENHPSLPLDQTETETEIWMGIGWHRGSRPALDRSTANVHKDKDGDGD
jgi:hypothetical protein